MLNSYSLSPRRARLVRFAAMLFIAVGLGSLIGPIAVSLRPGVSIRCGSTGCLDWTNLIDLAPEDQRNALNASTSARHTFATYLTRPLVRAGLAGVGLIGAAPYALLMLFVGLALAQLAARRGDDLARALPWLRRASVTTFLMVIVAPLGDSLRAMILYPGTPSGPVWDLQIEFRSVTVNLLLALAVFAVVWAIDAGSRAERDMADFV